MIHQPKIMLDNQRQASIPHNPSARDVSGVAAADSRSDAQAGAPDALSTGSRAGCVSNSGQWFVARHRPYQANLAVERARAAGFDVIAPMQTVRKPGRDDVISPVFPGYLFVRLDLSRRDWGLLLQPNIGLVGILATPFGTPIPLPSGFVEGFMQLANSDGVFPYWWPGDPPASVRLADRIGRQHRVTAGPWVSFTGRCVSANRNKVALLLELFGRQTIVEFRAEQVEQDR